MRPVKEGEQPERLALPDAVRGFQVQGRVADFEARPYTEVAGGQLAEAVLGALQAVSQVGEPPPGPGEQARACDPDRQRKARASAQDAGEGLRLGLAARGADDPLK